MPRKAKKRSRRPSSKTLVKRGQLMRLPPDPVPTPDLFFTPRPRVQRLTDHGLRDLENMYDGNKLIATAVNEIRAIRDRELSAHEWMMLKDLRERCANVLPSFVDVVDRVIDVLETER